VRLVWVEASVVAKLAVLCRAHTLRSDFARDLLLAPLTA
jgi:hypothetical protein